jgi:hypothetical protein
MYRWSTGSLPPPVNEHTGAHLRHLDCYTAAACSRLTGTAEQLDREYARGTWNAGARLDSCPLEGIVINGYFLGFRWRSGISTQERFSRTPFAKLAHSTPGRAVARAAPCVMRNWPSAGPTVEPASSGLRAGFVRPTCLLQLRGFAHFRSYGGEH